MSRRAPDTQTTIVVVMKETDCRNAHHVIKVNVSMTKSDENKREKGHSARFCVLFCGSQAMSAKGHCQMLNTKFSVGAIWIWNTKYVCRILHGGK